MTQASHPPRPDYPSSAYAWYVVVVLTAAYVVSFIDRQILALLVEPIRRDLGLTDTQMGLIMGSAFALFYTILGIPLGWLADRFSRRGIIAAGITIWCLMTAACGLSRNFGQLFLARVGVGVGEAALSPSALSLISDYFPRERRGRAISFYNMGVSLGAGIAMIGGGWIIAGIIDAPPTTLPVVGEIYAWQTVFLVVGLPGLAIAALMATVREPERRDKLRVWPTEVRPKKCRYVTRSGTYATGGRYTAAISSGCPSSRASATRSCSGYPRCSSAPGAGTYSRSA